MIGYLGDSIKKERVEKLVPGIETCIKGNKYSVIFICVESKETSVPKAVSELLSIINDYQADLYIITQVTPVNTMEQLRVISGKVIVTLFDGHAINNMGPEIVIGGTNSAHKLFKSLFNDRFLSNGNFQYTSLVNSEVLHLLCYFKHANQVTSADLIRFSSGLTKEGGVDYSIDNEFRLNGYSNDCLLRALQLLEIYFEEKGMRTYLLNPLRRELALNFRKSIDYSLPYPHSPQDNIYFHDVDQAYGCFSNFSNHPIYMEGQIWRTTEHYYQAKKFDVHDIQQEIRLTLSPVAAKEIAWNNLDALVENWHDIKCDVMMEALKAKFSQHIELKELLIATGTKTIVEYSPNDTYWGDPGDGSGVNKLGHMLMKLRGDINIKCEI